MEFTSPLYLAQLYLIAAPIFVLGAVYCVDAMIDALVGSIY